MAQRLLPTLLLIISILPGLAPGLRADGFIYIERRFYPQPIPLPRPIPGPVPRPEFPLEVVRHRVSASIEDSVARTRVEETFRNPNDFQLEGTYLFPLPPGASIARFSMLIGGREVQGEVLEREKARGIYESIVRQMRDPGLLEFVDRGLFRARVFPIPARGDVEVRIEYEERLQATGGLARYRYPLNTGKYSAGAYRDVLIDVSLRSRAPLRSVTSPSHPVSLTRPSDREARVVFEARTLQADRDFLLDFYTGDDALAPVLLTQRTHEADGFFLLSIAPRVDRSRLSPAPKDLVAVIDTSGSMVGQKMDEARKALRHFVQALRVGDRFNLIDFSTEARRFREGLVEVNDETRRGALAYVDALEARGGTNIEEALRIALAALDSAPGEGRLAIVTLITDGEPTVGVTEPQDILRSVRERNGRGRRIHCFGVGVDLNARLLEDLAAGNHGALDFIAPGENLELKLSSFWDKIDFPIFTDIRLEFPNSSVSDVYPKPLPDLFRGEELAVLGRFRDGGRRSVVLRGRFQGEEKVFEYSLDFDDRDASGAARRNDFIPRLWATRKIGYLLEEIRRSGRESRELKDEVIRLSQAHGVLTPYTSYLILEEGEQRRGAGGVQLGLPATRLLREAESAPASPLARAGGLPAESAGRSLDFAKRSFGAEKGEEGIAGSRAVQVLKDGKASDADRFRAVINQDKKRIQQVGSRAFYLQGDRWVEGGLEERELAAPRKIEYLSDAYFALLTQHPGIGELLSVGEKVTFRWGGEVIAVE